MRAPGDGPVDGPATDRAVQGDAHTAGRPQRRDAGPADPPRRPAAGRARPPAARDTTLAIPADRPAVLGRDPAADLPIPSERISRHHCRFLTAPNGAVAVEDLGSSNGTLVNQQRISGRRILVSGDYVQAGDCLFRILLG